MLNVKTHDMDAKELRIGNTLCMLSISFDNPEPLEVVELKYKYARVKYKYEGKEKTSLVEYSELGCVVLTEEWLLKLGFENCLFSFGVKSWIKDGFELMVSDDGMFFNHYDLEIKYVHKLQNLYFALTGEELTVKES